MLVPQPAPEFLSLVELYCVSPRAFHREVERLLGDWRGEAVRRMRALTRGGCPSEGLRSFDDLLAEADRYGLRSQLMAELDEIRMKMLFRPNQTRLPSRRVG